MPRSMNIPDVTFKRFLKKLGVASTHTAAFFWEHRVYLGNTLLCYRTLRPEAYL
jgi:hypothetical protein